MSNFSTTLRQVLEHEERTQADLARGTGLAESSISRILKGVVPERETLARVITAATGNIHFRYELLIAHLMDEVESSQLPLSGLVLRRAADAELTVPPDMVLEFSILADGAKDFGIRKSIKDLADIARRILEQGAVSGPSYPLPSPSDLQVAEDPPALKPVTPRKNAGAPTARRSLPPKSKAS